MKDLNETRENINKIDEQMTKLFTKRMNLCKEVAEYKKANSMPILDSNREEAVINNNLKFVDNDDLKPYYINYIKSLLNISKEYQRSRALVGNSSVHLRRSGARSRSLGTT